MTRLNVNIDHIATIRQARQTNEPNPVSAAVICELAGADGITTHLRSDRRHIQDHDLLRIRGLRRGELNLEMALTAEMVEIALRVRPERVTLVPEKREELTTEGGLDLRRHDAEVKRAAPRFQAAGITLSLFLDPEEEIVALARGCGAAMVEIHTGAYANATAPVDQDRELARIQRAARELRDAGVATHAGHGLNVSNVGALLHCHPFSELSIGHHIISRAVEIGMAAAVGEMLGAIRAAS
jgi:pyridoxine 5''-phosphate synthase